MPKKKEQKETKVKSSPQDNPRTRKARIPKRTRIGKEQVDGKDYSSPKARPRSLNELWGFKGDKFGTTNEEEYRQKLSNCNKADLQDMCVKVGLMPNDSRTIMVDRLIREFRRHVMALQTQQIKPKPVPKFTDKLRRTMGDLGGNTLV